MEVELWEGMVLHVLPASKRIIDTLQRGERSADFMVSATAEILCNNREGVTVTVEDVEQLPMASLKAFFEAYAAFISGKVDEDPN